MVNSWRSLLVALLLVLLVCGSALAAKVSAVADRDRIAKGESLQLELRVEGSPDGDPDLSGLEQNWEILSRSHSSQMQIINGDFSRSLVYSLTLMPRTTGTLTIPAICFGKDCSLPLPIAVSDQPATASGDEDPLLLESEISPAKIVSQGELLFKVRLLRRVDLLEGQLTEPQPTGVNAVVKKLGDDRSYQTRRNGLLYQVIERDYAIFPQDAGTLRISPLQFDGSIASGRSRFDPFGQQGQRVRRNSQPLTVEVTPLPADLGRRPWIPASGLKLSDDWQQHPPKLRVGEPATRTLRLSATGVEAAQLPELQPAVPDRFKTYPDQPKRDNQVGADGITGVLEQKIALVPTQAGHYTLPAVDLDWWDVKQGKWQHAHLAPVELEVTAAPGATASAPTAAPPQPPAPTAPVPAPQKPEPAAPVPAATSAGFWPWLSLALALAWLLTLLMLWRQRRPAPTTAEPPASEPAQTVKTARKAVMDAARRHDPAAARQALRTLSHALWPAAPAIAYEQLRRAADPDLRRELAALDHCLFGTAANDWKGDGLAVALSAWRAPATSSDKTQLPELYP